MRRRVTAGAPTRDFDTLLAWDLVARELFRGEIVAFDRASARTPLFVFDFAPLDAGAFLTRASGFAVSRPTTPDRFRFAPARALLSRTRLGELADLVAGLVDFLGDFPLDTKGFRFAIVLDDRGKCRPDGFLIFLFLADFFVKADIRGVRVRW